MHRRVGFGSVGGGGVGGLSEMDLLDRVDGVGDKVTQGRGRGGEIFVESSSFREMSIGYHATAVSGGWEAGSLEEYSVFSLRIGWGSGKSGLAISVGLFGSAGVELESNIRRFVLVSGCRVRVRDFGAAVNGDQEFGSLDIENNDPDNAIGTSRFRK